MDKIKRVEESEVFKRSHQFTLLIYKITKTFPSLEKFGLVPQMTRERHLCAQISWKGAIA